MDGYGVLKWRDGKKYEGNFVNDKREGQGTFMWADGRKYIGEWKAGKQHGIGTYISKDGVQRRGQWVNGRKQAWFGDEKQEDNDDDPTQNYKD
jgi:hypothetical protein